MNVQQLILKQYYQHYILFGKAEGRIANALLTDTAQAAGTSAQAAAQPAQTVATDWHGEDALLLVNDAWLRLADYYATLQ